MRKQALQGFIVDLALVLSAINIGLLIFGAQWVKRLLSGVAEETKNEAVMSAAQKIESALYIGLWVLGLILTLVLLQRAFRAWRSESRAEEDAEVRSYMKNVARARREARRRRRHPADRPSSSPISESR